ncbi:hypothetical protein GHK92_10490 [Nocardioides sp. dk4132]|uniref:hypothetical protein n=1 Tax=unclassified Nocardioides TaxID=2615069 RepID=UPI001294CE30|nr:MULTISPECIES: hypothetical protein [unclassified Nocardioides]MQW76305.1 hypothetical protein [Nocardioides sp. dk4132]QGA07412.1 hypothetical protein GFH29_08435 [Nocardioides sp. dk884]
MSTTERQRDQGGEQWGERLRDLAEEAPGALPEPALWDRGRRYARLRRRGTAVVAALGVLAVVAVGAVSWQRAAPPAELAPASAPAAMPDELFVPSPWLPGTEEAGPLGQLAAIIPADRGGWTGAEMEIAGVSATTREYRFLDLPDLYAPPGAVLSPDGRHVAYWATGEPSGTPNDSDAPVTAVGLYDAASGEVERYDIETEHGLAVEDLVWTDPSTLLVSYGQWQGGEDDTDMDVSMSRTAPWEVLRVGDELRELGSPLDHGHVWGGGDGVVVMSGSGRNAGRWLLDPTRPRQPQRLRTDRGSFVPPRVSPDRTRIAGVPGHRAPNRLAVADLSGDTRAEYVTVPGDKRTFEVLDWSDDDHVVVLRHGRDDVGEFHVTVMETDVETGEQRELVDVPAALTNQPRFALDLLGGPIVEAVEPPDPMDPRAVVGLSGGAVAAAGAGIFLWRRRVQP